MIKVKSSEDAGINIVDSFEHVPPGSMGLDIISTDDGINWRTAIFVKTDKKLIESFGLKPQISIRVAVTADNDVYQVIIITKIGRNSYLESFLNFHAENIGRPIFEGLASQLYIPVIFLGEIKEVVSVSEAKNQVRYGFKEYLKYLPTVKPWTMDAFNEAKSFTMSVLPPASKLWEMNDKPPSLNYGLEVAIEEE